MPNALTTVPGSLSAVAAAAGMSLAQSFLNCELLVLIDQSASMADRDAPGGLSRFEAADAELARLQREHPGQVAVVSFSQKVAFCPGGVPSREYANTDVAAALRFVRVADGACQIVLISDGEPDSERAALAEAAKFKHAIHTIYIGSEADYGGGRAFLQRLAAATGGRTFESNAPGLLAESAGQLLLA